LTRAMIMMVVMFVGNNCGAVENNIEEEEWCVAACCLASKQNAPQRQFADCWLAWPRPSSVSSLYLLNN
jgi:hypothetical protein